MATPAQLTANHANALLSTGPRTAAGKQASAANSRRHGLACADDTLAHEQSDALAALLTTYTARFRPADELAHTLVRQLALAQLRLSRVEQREAALLEQTDDLATLTTVERYRASAERSFYRALAALDKLQRTQQNEAKAQAAQDRREADAEFHALIERCCAPPMPSSLPNEPNATPQPSRNQLCPCHSGLKYKRCCGR